MAAEIRVVLADDHPLLRRGLVEILSRESDLVLAGEAADGAQALALLESARPHVAVLDIDMPRMNGLELAAEVRRRGIAVELIFLTIHEEREYLEHALSLGARGYVLKDAALSEIVAAVRAAASGEHYVSPRLSSHLVERRRASTGAKGSGETDPLVRLSPAERRVLAMVADYRTSREIAAELHVSLRTVETHRANIATKLGLRGSHSLMKFALEHRDRLP